MLKGLDFVLKIPSWSLRNTDLTQNPDWTWNNKRKQTFRTSLSLGCLPCGESCDLYSVAPSCPLSLIVYKSPLVRFTGKCNCYSRPKEKKGLTPLPYCYLIVPSLHWILWGPRGHSLPRYEIFSPFISHKLTLTIHLFAFSWTQTHSSLILHKVLIGLSLVTFIFPLVFVHGACLICFSSLSDHSSALSDSKFSIIKVKLCMSQKCCTLELPMVFCFNTNV